MRGKFEATSPEQKPETPHDEQEKMEKMRERVSDLKKSDNEYEDSIYTLAKTEDAFRDKLREKGLDQKSQDALADIYSDQVLEKIELGKENRIDELTRLRNRKAFNEEVPQTILMEKRHENSCALLIIDFDKFKEVNDTFGHSVGDQALQKAAAIISDTTRASDLVYRFGGEEFAVLLPNTTSADATIVAEKIRKAFEATPLEVTDTSEKSLILKKTISIGYASTDQLEEWQSLGANNVKSFLSKLINYSDTALYSSKNNGRNRVTLFHKDLPVQDTK